MIYELRTYTLVPGKQAEYLKLNEEIGRRIRGDKYGKLFLNPAPFSPMR